MRHSAGADEDLTFTDRDNLPPLSLRLEVKLHIAFHLIKELIPGLDMKIEPRIGSPKDHHEKVFMMDQQLVGPKRRVEVALVLLNPALEMKCRDEIHSEFNKVKKKDLSLRSKDRLRFDLGPIYLTSVPVARIVIPNA